MDIKDFVSELKQELVIQNRLAEVLGKYKSEYAQGNKIGIENTIKAINEIIEKFEGKSKEEPKIKGGKRVVLIVKNF